MWACVPFLLLAAGAVQGPFQAPGVYPEFAVASALEEVRKGELMLDADVIEPHIAASFTLIEGGDRVSGSFAYLETVRRLRERGAEVKELRFDQILVRVFGGSAIASYTFTKRWKQGGAAHLERGWSSDVFELRDDGLWILVHRHRK